MGWEACGGLAAVVVEAVRRTRARLCGDVRRTCGAARRCVEDLCMAVCGAVCGIAVRRCVEDLCIAVWGCASWGRDVRG